MSAVLGEPSLDSERASTSTVRPSEMENPETPDSDSKAG